MRSVTRMYPDGHDERSVRLGTAVRLAARKCACPVRVPRAGTPEPCIGPDKAPSTRADLAGAARGIQAQTRLREDARAGGRRAGLDPGPRWSIRRPAPPRDAPALRL